MPARRAAASVGFPGPLPAHPDAWEAHGHAAWHAEVALPGDPRGFDVVWRVPHQQFMGTILGFIGHRGTPRDPVPQITAIIHPLL